MKELADHKRESDGLLALRPFKYYRPALDAEATKILKAGEPGADIVPPEHRCERASLVLKDLEAERQALRAQYQREIDASQEEIAKKVKRARPIGDRNAAERNQEALGWIVAKEDDPSTRMPVSSS